MFYTDTHYGENLIEFNKNQRAILQNECNRGNRNCFERLKDKLDIQGAWNEQMLQTEIDSKKQSSKRWIELLRTPCPSCQYKMLQITIEQMKDKEKFPFVKVGRLTLTYNENGQLTKMDLEKCAEHVAMKKYNNY